MSVWLLTWNPEKSTWSTLLEDAAEAELAGYVHRRWSCGNARHIEVGDHFFLLRQGDDPRGLMASGLVESTPYEDEHWSGEGTAWYVDTVFDSLYPEPVVDTEELASGSDELSSPIWRTQASGVRVPPTIALRLDEMWEERTGMTGSSPPDQEAVQSDSLPEGALRRVAVNSYERNPAARRRCMQHYGYGCSVCGVLLEEVYGTIAKSFVEVHHLKPLSELRGTYRVDPIKDLVPVCPNCHSIIHRQNPALTLDQARAILK